MIYTSGPLGVLSGPPGAPSGHKPSQGNGVQYPTHFTARAPQPSAGPGSAVRITLYWMRMVREPARPEPGARLPKLHTLRQARGFKIELLACNLRLQPEVKRILAIHTASTLILATTNSSAVPSLPESKKEVLLLLVKSMIY